MPCEGRAHLYAWGDAYAYLTRRERALRLSLEHRSHPPCEPLALSLVSRPDGSGTHLELAPAPTPALDHPLEDLVLSELSGSQTALRRTHLRARLRVNNLRLGQALEALRAQGRVRADSTGWSLVR
jgi:hypothetical protein